MFTILSLGCQGQNGLTGLFMYANAFTDNYGPWAGAGYSSSLSDCKGFAAGMQGEKLFGTDLSFYELSLQSPLKNVGGLGLVTYKKGTHFMWESAASISWGKKLGDRMRMGIRLGYQMRSALGYGSEATPVAGLGLGFKITDQCQWLFQGDGINNFFSKENDWGYRIRTGLGYKFSNVCFGTMEILAEPNTLTRYIAAVHYSPVDAVTFKAGISNDLFLLSAGFRYHDFDIGVNAGWHLIMGMSTGMWIGYGAK